MIDSVYLAWRYLRFQRFKTTLLVASITLVIFLPVALQLLVDRSSQHLMSRAATTPLVVGAKGSELELALNTLYFESRRPATLPYGELVRVQSSQLATPIPIYCRFVARERPIVGTTLEYFRFRQLQLSQGRALATLGDCVAGAEAARQLALNIGDGLVSSPETMFDLAGVYPLKMRVVGILAPTGEPDDRVIFVDIKTAWIIEGLGHGHQDLGNSASADQLLKREAGEVTANASVPQFTEVTPENEASFHFHGDRSTYPLTAVIAVPNDAKSETLLLGRYQGPQEKVQIIEPLEVIGRLLNTVLTIRTYLMIAAGLVGISTLLAVVLIFLLSIRVRQREIETLEKIGASKGKIWSILACEMGIVLGMSVLLALGLTGVMALGSESVILWFVGG